LRSAVDENDETDLVHLFLLDPVNLSICHYSASFLCRPKLSTTGILIAVMG
jgi:hypothetical protein